MEESIDAMRGEMRAVTETITALILAASPITAARAAVHLEIARDMAMEEDALRETPSGEQQSRDGLLSAYLGLLSSRAQQHD